MLRLLLIIAGVSPLVLVLGLGDVPAPTPTAGPSAPAQQFVGRVAVACQDGRRRNAKYWTEASGWRDFAGDVTAACPASENDADTYRDLCRRAYPGRTIVNVEPAVELEAFANWCPVDASKTKNQMAGSPCPILNVRPFECLLSGPFQSPSLLVPHGCRFKHNASDNGECRQYEDWRQLALSACADLPGLPHLDRYAPLQPCNNMLTAGYFGAVEFVCCPAPAVLVSAPEVERGRVAASKKSADEVAAAFEKRAMELQSPSDQLGLGKDADEIRYQRYLSLPTESGHSEHERFLDAKRGLRHHQAVREGAMVKELREAEARILSVSPRDPDSAQRLLAEVEKQFQRSFISVQREEEAEHDQLDSVHQQRVNLLFVGKVNHFKRLLAQSVAEGKADAAERYFSRLAALIVREIVRLANRANRLSPRLTVSHLANLRRHVTELRADLKDSSADAGLRRLLDLSVVSSVLARYESVLAKADKQLNEASASGSEAESAYPPKLAERFDNLLRLYHEKSVQIMKLARQKYLHSGKTAHEHHHGSSHHHQQQQHQQHPRIKDGHNGVHHRHNAHPDDDSDSGVEMHSVSHEDPQQHQQQQQQQQQQHFPRQSLVFVIIFCSLAFLLTLVVIFVTVRICRMVYGANAPSGKGYKLSLVDDDEPNSAPRSGCCSSANGAPYAYPTVQPEKACLGDPHLANMQMNGYENPTYKFYEEK